MARTTPQATLEHARSQLEDQLEGIYTPSTPITDARLFSGRQELLTQLKPRLRTKGMHFVLYGERGVGKTSFCNVLFEGRTAITHTCSHDDTFVSIFRRVLAILGEELVLSEETSSREGGLKLGAPAGSPVAAEFSGKAARGSTRIAVSPQELNLNFVLDRVVNRQTEFDAIIIDEFEKIKDNEVHTELIEVSKGLANRQATIKIAIVGVAGSDEDLIRNREYLEYKGRHLTARRIPVMSDDEVRGIFRARKTLFNIRFADEVEEGIVSVAGGYPAIAQQLALQAALNWISREWAKIVAVVVAGAAHGLLARLGIHRKRKRPPSISDLGMKVEMTDFHEALKMFREDFRGEFPSLAEEVAAFPDEEHVQSVVDALAWCPAAAVSVDEIAARSGLEPPDVDDIARRHGEALLIEAPGGQIRLRQPQLRSFIRSGRYMEDVT